MKTLLTLLLIPSLCWGFFGKKYDCEPEDLDFFIMRNHVKDLSSHTLKLSTFKDNLSINFDNGNIAEIHLIKENDKVLIYEFNKNIELRLSLPLDKNINVVWEYPEINLNAYFSCQQR